MIKQKHLRAGYTPPSPPTFATIRRSARYWSRTYGIYTAKAIMGLRLGIAVTMLVSALRYARVGGIGPIFSGIYRAFADSYRVWISDRRGRAFIAKLARSRNPSESMNGS